MYKKYIEQPAFETNQFKVGNPIAFYRQSGMKVGEVADIKECFVEVVYQDDFKNKKSSTLVHFKQCRLLKEVKPTKYWVKKEDLIPVHRGHEDDPKRPVNDIGNSKFGEYGYIEVSKVLDE